MENAGHRLPEDGRRDGDVTVAPTAVETARLAREPDETPPLVVAFAADAGGREPVSCPVPAERPGIPPGLVPRHPRPGAEAAPGARDWPGPPLPTD
ncbi:hypothetical protein ABZ471_15820 [Streptomyces sp. NPDC005728]|uniref:hypothetical protein n=1 Tax=Streptomyces sp. NPDC005728 TaxID=3157054 RepID=UPI0033D43FA1